MLEIISKSIQLQIAVSTACEISHNNILRLKITTIVIYICILLSSRNLHFRLILKKDIFKNEDDARRKRGSFLNFYLTIYNSMKYFSTYPIVNIDV